MCTFWDHGFHETSCKFTSKPPEEIARLMAEADRERAVKFALERADDVRRHYAEVLGRGERPHYKTPDATIFDITAEAILTLADEVRRLTPSKPVES